MRGQVVSHKRKIHHTWYMRLLARLKVLDLYSYEPIPQFVGGDQISSFGFFATVFTVVLVLVYIGTSLERFFAQQPSVAIVQFRNLPTGDLFPFSIQLKNPAKQRSPLSRRSGLTVDSSYFKIVAQLTSVEPGYENAENTQDLQLMDCDDEINYKRRTANVEGFCPGTEDGRCPPFRLCFDPVTANDGSRLAGDCDVTENCERVQVTVQTCAEPYQTGVANLGFTTFEYSQIPVPNTPPASEWSFTLMNATGILANLADGSAAGIFVMRPKSSWPWGFVCNDGFDQQEARVACETMGLPTKYVRQLSPTSGLYPECKHCQYYMDNSGCPSTATNFVNGCGFLYYPYGVIDTNCGTAEAVGLYCGNTRPYQFEFQLVNSSTNSMGLLLVRPKGTSTWATLMRDNFTDADARAVCRAVGFDVYYARLLPQGIFGKGDALRYYIDHSRCAYTSTEGIDDCAEILWADFRQRKLNEDVSLDCSFVRRTGVSWEYQLIHGTSFDNTTLAGRGMILLRPNSSVPWGGVCSFDFNGVAAGAACRALGFPVRTARVLRVQYNKSVVRPQEIYQENIRCDRDSVEFLEECSFKFMDAGTDQYDRSYDCGGSHPDYSIDLELKHQSIFAWVDCNHECASSEDIQQTAALSGLQFNLSLDFQGRPRDTLMSTGMNVEFQRKITFLLAKHNTTISPDFFHSWRTEQFSDLALYTQSNVVENVFLQGWEHNSTRNPRVLARARLALTSIAYVEQQTLQNSADLLGSLYAFYASMFGMIGLPLVWWNKRKFFKKNPGWSKVYPDMTTAFQFGEEGGGKEMLAATVEENQEEVEPKIITAVSTTDNNDKAEPLLSEE